MTDHDSLTARPTDEEIAELRFRLHNDRFPAIFGTAIRAAQALLALVTQEGGMPPAPLPEGMETTGNERALNDPNCDCRTCRTCRDLSRALAEIARLKTAVLEWGDAAHRQAAEVSRLTAALADMTTDRDNRFREAWKALSERDEALTKALVREQRAREEEREACAAAVHKTLVHNPHYDKARDRAVAAIRARSTA